MIGHEGMIYGADVRRELVGGDALLHLQYSAPLLMQCNGAV